MKKKIVFKRKHQRTIYTLIKPPRNLRLVEVFLVIMTAYSIVSLLNLSISMATTRYSSGATLSILKELYLNIL
jgi:hypothetical protein